MYGVRNELNARGIDNSRIGWNQGTGYVTIDGQNFLKPPANVKNVTYSDPTAFDQAYNTFNSNRQLNTMQSNVNNLLNQAPTNPYNDQVNTAIEQFYNRMNNPAQYNPYGSPEYAAYQAQAQRNADQGIRASQEALGAAGFGRSTNLAERAQGIQNQANEYLEMQVIPQLIAANQQKEQQALGNMASYLQMLTGQQSREDTLGQNQLRNAMDYLGYLSGQRNQYTDEQYRTGRDTVADGQWNQSFDRNVLESDRAFDRNVLESDRDYGLAVANLTGIMPDGSKTSAEQQREISNQWMVAQQTGTIPNQLADMYGIKRGTRTQDAIAQAEQIALGWANNRIAQQNANTSAGGLQLDRDKFNYSKQQNTAKQNATNTPKTNTATNNVVPYKKNPDFAQEVAYINNNPTKAVNEIKSSSKELIETYGYDGYQELLKQAEKAAPKAQNNNLFAPYIR